MELNYSNQQPLYFILEIMCHCYPKIKINIKRTNGFSHIRKDN